MLHPSRRVWERQEAGGRTDRRVSQRPTAASRLRYWAKQRGDRAMPTRRDIDPLDLRSCLGCVCLVEVLREPELRFLFRLDGSCIAQITGFDLTGKFADEIPDAAYREYVLAIYWRIVSDRSPVFLRHHEEWDALGLSVCPETS
ncbi:MAG: PAS domain-containing protein [Dongiaceae bacterium]